MADEFGDRSAPASSKMLDVKFNRGKIPQQFLPAINTKLIRRAFVVDFGPVD